MRLKALHHVTMITADAQANVDFVAGVLGLRLVKQTVNFDQPNAYHLYFGDERGTPGSLLTWFEFAGARPGREGAGMIHTLELGVPSASSLDFWEERLGERGVAARRSRERLALADPDGLRFELAVGENPALPALHPEIPAEHAITGIEGVRAYGAFAGLREALLTDVLGFEWQERGSYLLAEGGRQVRLVYEPPPREPGRLGAGTVHHVAWHCADDDQLAWQARVREVGGEVTEVRDRDYFKSVYFREPRGVLFELATTSPGFAVDEDPDHLGEQLKLPRQHEHLRDELRRTLRPIVNPRA